MPTGIRRPRLRSSSAHWDWELAKSWRRGAGEEELARRRTRRTRRRRRRRRIQLKSNNPYLIAGELIHEMLYDKEEYASSECHEKAVPRPHLFIQCFPSLSPFTYLSFFPACSQVYIYIYMDIHIDGYMIYVYMLRVVYTYIYMIYTYTYTYI